MNKQCRNFRLGIFGGTFNPIHLGHLVTAEAVRVEYGLSRILFIPAANPPHKHDPADILPADQRLAMTVMAVHTNPHFSVSDMELQRTGPSYTVDTIDALRENYGEAAELWFITGADAMNELSTWHHAGELLEKCHFIVADRHGTELETDALKQQFGELAETHIHRAATPAIGISSTDIRKRIRERKSIKYMVPEKVETYIHKEGLYR